MHLEWLYQAQQSVLWGGLLLLWILEALAPRERRSWRHRARHGARNATVWLISIVVVSVLFGTAFAQATVWLERNQVGLLHATALSPWLRAIAGFLLLDFSAYVIHRLSHSVRMLWLLHCVHHSDADVDVTTNLRHHPLHVVCTMLWKIVGFAAIGPPAFVLLLHELVVITIAHLHHSALAWPTWIDRALSWLIVSPRAHWVHHSCVRPETDANFGATLSWWDRLGGTYLPPATTPPRFGLAVLDARYDSATGMLWTPVRARKLAEL